MHSIDSNANIPTFILKLWKLVSDESSNDLICWNRNGRSFIIKDQGRFAKEVLPLYFKHSNMASFIRQLNMYGFRKLTNIDNGGLKSDADEVEFFHQYFTLGQEDHLQFIKRKLPNNKLVTSITKVDEIQDILADVESIKGRQDSVDTQLNDLKRENEALWREIAILRQKHMKQQQIVEKLLQFLVSIVRNRVVGGIKRKAPLLIDSNLSTNRKILKDKEGNAICIAPSSSTSGPIIHDITDLEDSLNIMNNMEDSQENSLSGLQLSMEPTNDDCKSQHSSDSSSLVTATESVEITDQTHNLQNKDSIISLPEISEIVINQDPVMEALNNQNEQMINQQQDFNHTNFILNTPKIQLDEATIAELMKNQQANHFNNGLVLPASKQKTPTSTNMPKLTSENFNDHVEGIDTELNWLQDQLYGNIDPSTILGLFSSDNQFIDGTDLSSQNQSGSEPVPKAIMDGPNDHNKIIKVEDNSNSDLFDELDLNSISGNDTKDILSEFTNDADSSAFN